MIRKRLGDIINFKRGYDLPLYKRKDGNYPVISSSGVSGYHSEFKAEGEGLITGRYGTLGEVYYVNGKYWPHNTALYVTDFKGNYPKYVYFLLKQLGNLKTSDKSTVPGVNRNDLHEIMIPYIEPDFQKPIADCLFELEEKIKLNDQASTALESIAKTLHDYWFVQFDFLGINGEPYKSSGGKMIYDDKLRGDIPAGWDSGVLSDIAYITMGQSPPGSSYNEIEHGIIFFQGCTDFGVRFPTVRQYTTCPTRFAEKGDILLSVRAPVGELNIAPERCCIGRGLGALRSRNNSIAYLLGVMRNFNQIFERRNADGTTFGAITKDDLYALKVVIPPDEILTHFQAIGGPIFEQQDIIAKENQRLVELRDWLLPMLTNGQVMVSTKAAAILL